MAFSPESEKMLEAAATKYSESQRQLLRFRPNSGNELWRRLNEVTDRQCGI
jgi:hypothetical protein